MTRIPVISSNVAAVGYDPLSKVLEVQFHSGATYQYFEVPDPLYRAFMRAPSLGKYLHEHIKHQFRFLKV